MPPDERGRGPFSSALGLTLRREARPDVGAVISHPQDAVVLKLFPVHLVLSSYQVAGLAGLSEGAAKESVKRLFRLGFLDRLLTGVTPPLYALGEAGANLFGAWRREWDAASAFRLAAANQLCLALKRVWPELDWKAGPGLGAAAKFSRKEREYWVLAPRCGEAARAISSLKLFPQGFRVIVVAGDENLAAEIAGACPAAQARYTWDVLLKDGPPVFYRWNGAGLEEAERFEAA
jgi:hypothetical protein